MLRSPGQIFGVIRKALPQGIHIQNMTGLLSWCKNITKVKFFLKISKKWVKGQCQGQKVNKSGIIEKVFSQEMHMLKMKGPPLMV